MTPESKHLAVQRAELRKRSSMSSSRSLNKVEAADMLDLPYGLQPPYVQIAGPEFLCKDNSTYISILPFIFNYRFAGRNMKDLQDVADGLTLLSTYFLYECPCPSAHWS